jgi:tetratricopeptide (TPR) repeat protein
VRYLFIYCCFILGSAFSQSKELDSLSYVFDNVSHDSSRIRIYHEMYMVSSDGKYALAALKIAKKRHFKYGLALIHRDLGRHYFFDSKKDLALSHLSESIKYATEINDRKILATAYRYLGYITILSDPYQAKKHYEKSLKFSVEVKDHISESYALSALGNLYEGMTTKENHFNIALDFYEKSLKIRERYAEDSEIASSLNETARVYSVLGQHVKSANLRFKGLQIAEKEGDFENLENLIFLYNSIGNDLYFRVHDYKTSLHYQLKAYEKALLITDNVDIMFDVTKMVALCYNQLGKEIDANRFYKRCLYYYELKAENANKYDYSLSLLKHDFEEKLFHQKLLLKMHKYQSKMQRLQNINWSLTLV